MKQEILKFYHKLSDPFTINLAIIIGWIYSVAEILSNFIGAHG